MSALVTKKSRYLYLEFLRVICALAVIIIHVSGANWFKIGLGSPDWIVQSFLNVGMRFSVCVFCMISGALLLRPGKEQSPREIFSHYVKRILICYLAWIVLYALFYTVLNHEGASYFVTRLFRLPDHLWYLLMRMGLYLALPAIRLIAKNRTVTLYLIFLLVGVGAIKMIADTTAFFETIAGENYGFTLWTSFLGNFEELKFSFLPGYLGCFLLGHYIHEYGLGAWHKRIVCATIPALVLSGLLTVWISTLTDSYVYTFMLENNPLTFLACAGIFAFFRGQGETVQKSEPTTGVEKTLVWIASNTFGIYLVHMAVRDLLAECLGLTVASYPAALSVPLNALLIFLISLGITAVLRKIPVVQRIVS